MTSEFSTTASLEIVIDRASARRAKDDLHEYFGDTAATAAVQPAPSDLQVEATTASMSGPSVTAGMSASEPQNVGSVLTDQLEVQEAMWETLDDVEDHVGKLDGGLFGGSITDILVETGGGAAGEVSGELISELPDTLGDVLGTTLGTTLGNVIADFIPTGDTSSVSIDKPKWVPLPVESPGDIDVNVDEPGEVGVEKPEWSVDVEDPEPLAVDDPSPLSVEDIPPIEVPEIPPLSVDASQPTSGGVQIHQGGSTTQPTDTGVPGRGPVESIVDTAGFGASQGASAGMGLGPPGVAIGTVGGGALGAVGGALGYGYRWGKHELGQLAGSNKPQNTAQGQRTVPEMAVNYEPTYNIEVDVDRIIRRLKRAHEKDINRLEGDIKDLESDLDSLERALGGR